ncbi:hypothetical protein KOY48_01435 [Candidatus Minimicrobia naudis]|uniref:Uncharacterized protein n=1 Tax=Candidatus Minimicrobia naudis TaxID=2841263 RepID=A0A8F1MBT2_9BACT|nr:hypothetical protein KOY48_01435 [Candidatus Minimicrobia naudis]
MVWPRWLEKAVGYTQTAWLTRLAIKKRLRSIKKQPPQHHMSNNLQEYSDSEDNGKGSSKRISPKAIEKYSMTDNDVKKIQKKPRTVEKVTPAYSMYGVLYAKSSASNKKFGPERNRENSIKLE